jgi:hypothetical protein
MKMFGFWGRRSIAESFQAQTSSHQIRLPQDSEYIKIGFWHEIALTPRSAGKRRTMSRPNFDRDDDKKIDDSSALRPDLVYEVIPREGDDELGRTKRSLTLASIAAGLAISASVFGEAMIAKQLPDEPWAELVADIGYTFGFIIVILGRL